MILADLSISELKNLIVEMNEKPFRAEQIFKNIHNGKAISEMTDLSNNFKTQLLKTYDDIGLKIIEEITSKDGTKKFLFALNDGNVIEGVLMKYKYGNTICVSTQVGCRMGCAFCASTIDGLVRNLTAGEILSQILVVNKRLGGNISKRQITNVVLMGSGEPLDNYNNVIKFLRLLADNNGINISPRNVSLSTCGIVPKMLTLANEGLPVNLTLSLHSPFDQDRQKIMPIAKSYKIADIISALDNYFEKTGRRFYIEYSLIAGENDTLQCINQLFTLFKGKPCHINVIRLNSVKEKNLLGSTDKQANNFVELLQKKGLSATLRRRMGDDIDGACGQLRRRYLKGDYNN